MKTANSCLLLSVSLLLVTGCFRNDLRTETFQIANLNSRPDADALANALRPVSGIREFSPDFEKHTLTVVFEGDLTHIKNIEDAISQAGYNLPNRPLSR